MPFTEIIGYAAALAVLATFCMRTMLPLRVVALASNVLFALYGYFGGLCPVLALHLLLLPVNLVRLIQLLRVVRGGDATPLHKLPIQSVLPYMRPRRLRPGEILFRAGDRAEALFYVASGAVRIHERGTVCAAGSVVGEIGVFSPDRARTATVIGCIDAELYELPEVTAKQLCLENSQFSFAMMQLIAARLIEDSRRTRALAA